MVGGGSCTFASASRGLLGTQTAQVVGVLPGRGAVGVRCSKVATQGHTPHDRKTTRSLFPVLELR